jgi:16S rRNA (uracil1498-N3)-methyltransferase
VLPGAAAHVFVADLAQPELADDDRHHLERVLRLRAGEAVTASDGCGGWRLCRYEGAGRVSPVGEPSASPRPSPAVGVAFALVKGDRPEWAVQKLAEAGVDHIMPITTERCVVQWAGEKGVRHVARLRALAVAAARQSRQVWLPSVHEVQPLAVVVGAAGPVALAQMGGSPLSLAVPTILVGPEGGWAPAELDLALARVSLGPTVLRAETAAVAAGVLLCALRAGIVRPVT